MPHRYTDIPIKPSDSRNVRRSYLTSNAFEAMFALSAIVAGVSSFVKPETVERSALGDLYGVFALIWSATYIVSGASILYGLVRPNIRAEIVGLGLLGGAICGNAFALVSERSWLGAAAASFYIGWAAASVIRARLVIRLSRIIVLDRR